MLFKVAIKRIKCENPDRVLDLHRARSALGAEAVVQGMVISFYLFLNLSASLNHPSIVRILAICLSPLCIVSELCKYGDLYTYLHNYDTPILWNMRLQIAVNLAEGLAYMQCIL